MTSSKFLYFLMVSWTFVDKKTVIFSERLKIRDSQVVQLTALIGSMDLVVMSLGESGGAMDQSGGMSLFLFHILHIVVQWFDNEIMDFWFFMCICIFCVFMYRQYHTMIRRYARMWYCILYFIFVLCIYIYICMYFYKRKIAFMYRMVFVHTSFLARKGKDRERLKPVKDMQRKHQ